MICNYCYTKIKFMEGLGCAISLQSDKYQRNSVHYSILTTLPLKSPTKNFLFDQSVVEYLFEISSYAWKTKGFFGVAHSTKDRNLTKNVEIRSIFKNCSQKKLPKHFLTETKIDIWWVWVVLSVQMWLNWETRHQNKKFKNHRCLWHNQKKTFFML